MSSLPSLPIVPVIDLRRGNVVRGVAGNRSSYQPIRSKLTADSEPGTIAQALVRTFAAEKLYVADLDAIVLDQPQWEAYQAIAASGASLWLDAGIGTSCALARLEMFLTRHSLAADLVIGLESLASEQDWNDLLPRLDPWHFIFSVDLRQGKMITQIPEWQEKQPLDLVLQLFEQGLRRFILLDLAAVGMGNGVPTLELCHTIRHACPSADLQLIGGGGVRGKDDLAAMATAGFDAALVASALHDGRIVSSTR